jgi:hypothetical protein
MLMKGFGDRLREAFFPFSIFAVERAVLVADADPGGRGGGVSVRGYTRRST